MLDTLRHNQTLTETYTINCDKNDAGPLKRVMRYAHENLIDINVDNIRRKELKAIQQTLERFHKVHTIAFRSLHFKWPVKRKNEKWKDKKNDSCINPDVLTDICRTISISEASNQSLMMIELQNLPFTDNDILLIRKGLDKAKNLRFLSFENCKIGDGAVSDLCLTLKNCNQMIALNLSGCRIGDAGIRSIVNLLKYNILQRQGEVWKDSLRYQIPNLDVMRGLRRLTLNNNTQIGNNGSKLLCDVLRDDHWVKAIDLQNCGLGDAGGQAWLDLLKAPAIYEKGSKSERSESEDCYGNRTLGILDLRNNKNMDRDLLRAVTERVLKNAYGKQIEFKWLQPRSKPANEGQVTDWPGMQGVVRKDLDIPSEPQRVSTTNPSYQPKPFPVSKQIQRPSFKPAGGPLTRIRSFSHNNIPQPSLRRKKPSRRRSASLLSKDSSKQVHQRNSMNSHLNGDDAKSQSTLVNFDDTSDNTLVPGIPWRTAARAKGKSISNAGKETKIKVPQTLLNTLNEKNLVNGKRNAMTDHPMSSSVTSRRQSLRSSAKSSSRRARTTSSSSRSNRNSPEGRLRRQLQKHMLQRAENCNLRDHNDYAIEDLYNRLNRTLAQVEQVIKKIGESQKSKNKRSEADQLIMIQSTLRDLVAPMRRQLDAKKANKAPSIKSIKTTSGTSWSSLRRGTSKTLSSREAESTGSTKTAAKKNQPNRTKNSQTATNGSVQFSVNSETMKEKYHLSTTSLDEFVLAKPGRALLFQQLSSTETSSTADKTRTLPKVTFSTTPVAIKRMARSAPSLVKSHSKGCVDLFEDVETSDDVHDSEFATQTKSISTSHSGDAPQEETLIHDF